VLEMLEWNLGNERKWLILLLDVQLKQKNVRLSILYIVGVLREGKSHKICTDGRALHACTEYKTLCN